MAPLLILVGILFILAQVHAADDTCDRTYKKDGCFRGNKAGLVLAITDRDDSSRNYSGRYLEWGSYSKDLRSLICRCDSKAKELGYHYFAIEYYAECWMVSNVTLIRSDPAPQECVNVNITTCGEADEECAGKGFHQQVYKAGEIWVTFPFADSTGIDARKAGNLTIPIFPKEYMIQVNITFNSYKNGAIMTCRDARRKMLTKILIVEGGLVVLSRLNSKGKIHHYSLLVPIGKGIEVIMSQILRDGNYMQSFIIGGREKEVENKYATSFVNIKCAVGDNAADATIRNGVIRVKQN